MVRQRLLAHWMLLPVDHGPSLHFLQPQVGFPRRHWRLRGRVCNMWGCSQFCSLHYWSRSGWSWLRWPLLWSNDRHHEPCAPSQATNLTRNDGCYLWYLFCYRASVGWSLYNQSVLEMVLLHQPSHWRRCYHYPGSCSSYTEAQASWYALETADLAA